jgi:hypothetical protein
MMYNIGCESRAAAPIEGARACGWRSMISAPATHRLAYLHRFPDRHPQDRPILHQPPDQLGHNGPELARAVITLGIRWGSIPWPRESSSSPRSQRSSRSDALRGRASCSQTAGSLEELSKSEFVARRNALWTPQAAREDLSPTGRYRALKDAAGAAASRLRRAAGPSSPT